MRRPKPPADPALAAATPAGVQPAQQGHLLCLDCGGWHRRLDPHLRAAHGLTSAAYRERHGLRVRHPLVTQDVQQRFAENARSQMASDPQRWERHFVHTPEVRAAHAARGRTVAAATADRAERRATNRRTGNAVSAQQSRAARERLERRARELGYADLTAFLTARQDDSLAALSDMLGVTRPAVRGWLRRLVGVVPNGPAKAACAQRRALNRKAQAAGHADFATLIAATRAEPVKPLARRTGITANTIKHHRKAMLPGNQG